MSHDDARQQPGWVPLDERQAAERSELVERLNNCPACRGLGEGDAGACPCAECDGTGKRNCFINPIAATEIERLSRAPAQRVTEALHKVADAARLCISDNRELDGSVEFVMGGHRRIRLADALNALTAALGASTGEMAPIDMVLFCPNCHAQHIDAPDARTPDWTNPPHRSHLCHGCGDQRTLRQTESLPS